MALLLLLLVHGSLLLVQEQLQLIRIRSLRREYETGEAWRCRWHQAIRSRPILLRERHQVQVAQHCLVHLRCRLILHVRRAGREQVGRLASARLGCISAEHRIINIVLVCEIHVLMVRRRVLHRRSWCLLVTLQRDAPAQARVGRGSRALTSRSLQLNGSDVCVLPGALRQRVSPLRYVQLMHARAEACIRLVLTGLRLGDHVGAASLWLSRRELVYDTLLDDGVWVSRQRMRHVLLSCSWLWYLVAVLGACIDL